MRTKIILICIVSVICLAIISATGISPKAHNPLITPAYASPEATARQVTSGGRSVGEVLVGTQVVMRIRTSAGGRSPYQRAQLVAQRLEVLMSSSLRPEDITTGRVNGMDVVMAKGEVLITADAQHARLNGTTTRGLANLWATRLSNAVAGTPLAQTPTSEKVVPIISVGSGIRVGGALVSGARDRLDEVVAVAQLEGSFGNSVRVRALVPVSTTNFVQNLRRVPETSVIGLVDIKL